MGYLIRAPTGGRTAQTLQLNTAAPQNLRSVGTPPFIQGGFFMRRQPYRPPFVRLTDSRTRGRKDFIMAFFASAVGVLKTLVIALGAGLGIWGVVNLMEGYGNDNPGAKSQGMKQLMAGGGVALIGTTLVPLLANLFS